MMLLMMTALTSASRRVTESCATGGIRRESKIVPRGISAGEGSAAGCESSWNDAVMITITRVAIMTAAGCFMIGLRFMITCLMCCTKLRILRIKARVGH